MDEDRRHSPGRRPYDELRESIWRELDTFRNALHRELDELKLDLRRYLEEIKGDVDKEVTDLEDTLEKLEARLSEVSIFHVEDVAISQTKLVARQRFSERMTWVSMGIGIIGGAFGVATKIGLI